MYVKSATSRTPGPPRWRGLVLRVGATGSCLWLVSNLVAGYVGAHPRVTDLIWSSPHEGAFEAVVGGERVDTPTVKGRYIPPRSGGPGTIVLIHGYNGSIDSEPLVEVARQLHERDFGVLAINLGYRDGRHRYTGGHREADDIVAAIDWVQDGPAESVVAVWGFSAGAHAALVAASRTEVPAVIADSPFADAAAQIRRTAATTLRLPTFMFPLTPIFIDVFSGDHPINVLDLDWSGTPTLIIAGSQDHTVPRSDARAIAHKTQGKVVNLPVDHTQGVLDADEEYMRDAIAFLSELHDE